MTSVIQKILYEEAPELLTDHDARTIEAQEELIKLYAQPDEPLNAELLAALKQ